MIAVPWTTRVVHGCKVTIQMMDMPQIVIGCLAPVDSIVSLRIKIDNFIIVNKYFTYKIFYINVFQPSNLGQPSNGHCHRAFIIT